MSKCVDMEQDVGKARMVSAKMEKGSLLFAWLI